MSISTMRLDSQNIDETLIMKQGSSTRQPLLFMMSDPARIHRCTLLMGFLMLTLPSTIAFLPSHSPHCCIREYHPRSHRIHQRRRSETLLQQSEPEQSVDDLPSQQHIDIQQSNQHLPQTMEPNLPPQPTLREVDVLYDQKSELVYDPIQDRYVKLKKTALRTTSDEHTSQDGSTSNRLGLVDFWTNSILPRLQVAFLPAGVTQNYYQFMKWRVIQRFVNANLNVFGTQSLLMGLGIKSSASQLGALSAALKWVLKDALGKVVRMSWASRMGRRFDSDAKRWRFRSAFVFALGNFLEITTYIIPSMFLVWATMANCAKQMSMLTSSSTRTAIYNSFRDGSRENIGDITAKGEAQIAIVDLLGIASGVTLSRSVGTSVQSVLAVYCVLQVSEIYCMYRQLRTVVYRVFNFERMAEVLNGFLDAAIPQLPQNSAAVVGTTSATTNEETINGAHPHASVDKHHVAPSAEIHHVNGSHDAPPAMQTESETSTPPTSTKVDYGIKTPEEMARIERIFMPPRHLARRPTAFGSLGRAKLSPAELDSLIQIFGKERFILVVGANVKCPQPRRKANQSLAQSLAENCHIVLHTDASNADIVKSTLALFLLRRKLATSGFPPTTRSADCFDILTETLQQTDYLYRIFRRELARQGWESPARSMFGRVHMRAEWPLLQNQKGIDPSMPLSNTTI